MTTERTTPSAAQWIALLDFRDRHGRTWRDELSTKWMNGKDERERHAPHLRAIRNHFGPSWLYDLKPAELQRQRERFTLTLPRSQDDVKAEQDAVALSLATDDHVIWQDATPEERATYERRAALALLAVSNVRRERERGR